MSALTLNQAQTIIETALAYARDKKFRAMGVVVLDARAAVVAAAMEDGSSLKRFEIAKGKAEGAIAFGIGSRAIGVMAVERPHFLTGAAHAVGGGLVPVAGGVLIRDADGKVVGAVGVSGDTSDNDEAAAVAGIEAVGFVADGG